MSRAQSIIGRPAPTDVSPCNRGGERAGSREIVGRCQTAGPRLAHWLLACVLTVCASGAAAEGPYAELRWGVVQLDPLTGKGGAGNLSWISTAPSGSAVDAEIAHDDPMSFGAEAGLRGIFGTPLAVSLAVDTFRTESQGAQLSLFGEDVPAGITSLDLNRDELAARHVDFDSRVSLLSVNGYYEFEKDDLKLFVGLGYGLAFIGNADMAAGPMFHIGARYEIKPLGYVAVRVSRFQCEGPLHQATGLKFDDFKYNSLTLSFGIDL